ncbi:MAG: hypothetical protein H7258_12880 [Ferruginibacter sp.]|nr:hypothetical protein [Ferruginibacter sp.]
MLVTVSDKKIGVDNNSDGVIDYYNADVVTATDFYPFGFQMPGRKYSQPNSSYRYGFNGKENDNEVKGEGNQQDYGMRIYDPRLGRFLSEDPITKDYPELTPYQFASNRPIDGIDQDGLEYARANIHSDATVVRHNSDPNIAFKQVAAAPARQRAVFAADVQSRMRTQTGSAMSRYREPDAVKKQRNATLQRNHDAAVVPEGHWTRNKYLNNFSERAVEPMAEMAIGEGLGSVAAKGISLLMKVKLPSRLIRVIPEEFAGGARLGKQGAADVFVTDASQLKGLTTSDQIAQKLTLKNPDGSFVKGPFRLIEFDTPASGLAQPFNRGNPGYINGGKTAGGATEYVVPNAKISELGKVKQTTIQ